MTVSPFSNRYEEVINKRMTAEHGFVLAKKVRNFRRFACIIIIFCSDSDNVGMHLTSFSGCGLCLFEHGRARGEGGFVEKSAGIAEPCVYRGKNTSRSILPLSSSPN